jgi:micrococcal nuclease
MPRIAAVFIILMTMPNFIFAAPAAVVQVFNGDTLNVDAEGEKIMLRLYGIDAPESGQHGNIAATRFLKRLVLGSPVEIKVMETDRPNQTFAIVFREGEASSVNVAMVANGYAWVNPNHCKTDDCSGWKKIESQARTFKLGIWSSFEVVPPWQFKTQQRKQ